jgi:hypothetical protein
MVLKRDIVVRTPGGQFTGTTWRAGLRVRVEAGHEHEPDVIWFSFMDTGKRFTWDSQDVLDWFEHEKATNTSAWAR